MKIRLAKKIMKEGKVVKNCFNKRSAIPKRYWTIAALNYGFNEAGFQAFTRDHRITKAMSLTRKHNPRTPTQLSQPSWIK